MHRAKDVKKALNDRYVELEGTVPQISRMSTGDRLSIQGTLPPLPVSVHTCIHSAVMGYVGFTDLSSIRSSETPDLFLTQTLQLATMMSMSMLFSEPSKLTPKWVSRVPRLSSGEQPLGRMPCRNRNRPLSLCVFLVWEVVSLTSPSGHAPEAVLLRFYDDCSLLNRHRLVHHSGVEGGHHLHYRHHFQCFGRLDPGAQG